MARRAKPWWWAQKGQWSVTIEGQRHLLGPDKKAAEEKFHKLMVAPKVSSESLAVIVDKFLDWNQTHRSIATFDWYKQRLLSFLESVNPLMAAETVRAHHVEGWVDRHRSWGDSYRRGAMTSVARCLNWAEKKGHIERNPLRGKLDKPAFGKRDRVLSTAEYEAVLAHASPELADLITVCWETGCRPQEITRVEARHVDLENARWVFSIAESKGKKRERVVYLTQSARAITERLMKKYPAGALFRRRSGGAWSRHDVSQAFGRLKKHVGTRYRLYDLRHTYITNAIKNGVDPVTLQQLVGHADIGMISRVYAKVHIDIDYMREAAARATGGRV